MKQPRILISETAGLGDVVMVTPLLQRVRQALPDCFIGFQVRASVADLFSADPRVDVLLPTSKQRDGSIAGRYRWVRRLRRHNFDTALITDRRTRTTLIAWLAGIRNIAGFVGQSAQGVPDNTYTRVLLKHRIPDGDLEGRHRTLQNLAFAKVLDLSTAPVAERLYLDPQQCAEVEERLSLSSGGDRCTTVVVHPGAGWADRQWPPDRFAELVKHFHEWPAESLVLAGPGEENLAARVVEMAGVPSARTVGGLTVGELACLLSRCDLFVGHDTGTMHVAAAVNTPLVALYGPSSPEVFGPDPLAPATEVLFKRAECCPCPQDVLDPTWRCQRPHGPCVEDIALGEVIGACDCFFDRLRKER